MELIKLLFLATSTNFLLLFFSSAIACALGLSLALAEEHKLLPPWIIKICAVFTLIFIFYPKPIAQSTVILLINISISSSVGQSIWGLIASNFVNQLAICYLIFTLTIQVQSYSRPSALYLRNADGQPISKATAISIHPLRTWIAAGVAIAYCNSTFQAAMTGTTGVVTTGSYLADRLRAPGLSPSEHLALITAAITTLSLTFSLIFAISYFIIALWLKVVRNLGIHPIPRRKISHRKLIAMAIKFGVGLEIIVVLFLHLVIQLRLWGKASVFSETLGRPSGSLEHSLPIFPNVIEAIYLTDVGLLGAIIGSMFAISIWFSTLRVPQAGEFERWGAIVTVLLAVTAFLPSSFPGVVSLSVASSATVKPMLLIWSLIVACAFTALLIIQIPQIDSHYRYRNVASNAGYKRAISTFIHEYVWLLISLAILVVFANFIDDGFRMQLSIDSLGRQFRNINGQWSPQQRGLAIMLLGASAVVVFLLRRQKTAINAKR